jgi:hypothetical protein
MTPLQLQEDPSAQAPCTRRMLGRPLSLSPTPCVELWKGEFSSAERRRASHDHAI